MQMRILIKPEQFLIRLNAASDLQIIFAGHFI